MANQIRITPEQMRTRANEHRAVKDNELATFLTKMDSLLSTLESEWEGEASRAYADRWRNNLRPDVKNKVETLLDEIGAALDKTAQILEQTDTQIASGFKA
jgi:WXG100 family type VII secretion target